MINNFKNDLVTLLSKHKAFIAHCSGFVPGVGSELTKKLRITNDCLKKLFPRERIHYSKLHELAGYMLPIFQDFIPVTERKGNKASIILSIEKGKAGSGAVYRIAYIPSIEEMKKQVGVD